MLHRKIIISGKTLKVEQIIAFSIDKPMPQHSSSMWLIKSITWPYNLCELIQAGSTVLILDSFGGNNIA